MPEKEKQLQGVNNHQLTQPTQHVPHPITKEFLYSVPVTSQSIIDSLTVLPTSQHIRRRDVDVT